MVKLRMSAGNIDNLVDKTRVQLRGFGTVVCECSQNGTSKHNHDGNGKLKYTVSLHLENHLDVLPGLEPELEPGLEVDDPRSAGFMRQIISQALASKGLYLADICGAREVFKGKNTWPASVSITGDIYRETY